MLEFPILDISLTQQNKYITFKYIAYRTNHRFLEEKMTHNPFLILYATTIRSTINDSQSTQYHFSYSSYILMYFQRSSTSRTRREL